jgi:undecaprenyl-diphosphatase
MPFALIGLALAWGVMLLFGGLEFDRGLLVFAYAGRHPALVEAALWITELGDAEILFLASFAGALLLALRRDWRQAGLLAVITLSGRVLVELQKDWAGRIRPDPDNHLVAVQNLAFPSGHAANATLVWLCLALMLPRSPRVRFHAVWAAAWVALAVGASRVMLGVHWPSDVIGGWAFGLFWLLLWLMLAGQPLDEGTSAPAGHSSSQRRPEMTDRTRPDDSEIIDSAEEAPSFGGTSGGNLAREVAARAEEEHEVGNGGGEGDAVTRVHGADKPKGGDRPNLPNRN